MKKSIALSQNYLKSPKLVNLLIAKTSLGPADVVVEIGPGLGIITTQLVKVASQVLAIEADPRLGAGLRQKFAGNTKLKIIEGDFLAQPLPTTAYKVFSNIPFNITANVVRKLLEGPNPPLDAYLIMQKEAAQKFAAKTFAAKESQFSLLTKPWFEYNVLHEFRREDFQPAPAVDIVLLQIKKISKPLVSDAQTQAYRDFIVYSFNTNQANLKKAVAELFTYSQFKHLAQDLKFDLHSLPTELTFNQWLGMFEYFNSSVAAEKQQLVAGAESSLNAQQAKLTKTHRTRD